ncbi:MAG: GNAT family N-acetyltransferase [Hyphomonadaceae bacterium]|nr:GNAT family N-acetyltransferase [Hyphomonadaceae bacterium]MCA8886902.1 GNAT family N-acetyltransferase [Hyphomonadaceae bacterium]
MRDVIEIGTPRLKLRRLRMSDAQRVAQFCDDPGVGRNLAMTPLPYLPVAAEGWILINAARASRGTDFVYAVELPGEGLIGAIGAHARGGEGFEMGYWFGRPYWGQGFATEAATAFVSEAGKLGALEAGHFVDNPASGRVLTKVGFAYTGETKAMFSLGRGETVACKRMRFAPKRERGAGERAAMAMH